MLLINVATFVSSSSSNLDGTLKKLNSITFSHSEAPPICKWEHDWCGVGKGWREICVVTGDGNTCTCGEVTRDCDNE